MALAQLSVDLVAKVATFERDLKRGADAAVANSNRVAKALDVAKAGVAGLAASLSAGVLLGFVRSTVDAVDALNDVADATGASIENISALEDLAKRTGASLDDVAGILVKFNGALNDADPKKGVGAVIESLGLSLQDLKRQDPAEALRQVAVATERLGAEADKAFVYQELFGKSVRDAAPFVKDLAQAKRLEASVTAKQSEEAERFNKIIFQTQTNLSNLGKDIVLNVLPALNKLLLNFTNLNKSLQLGSGTSALSKANIDVTRLGIAAETAAKIAQANPGNEAAQKKAADLRAQLEYAIKKAATESEKLKQLADSVTPAEPPASAGGAPSLRLSGVGSSSSSSKKSQAEREAEEQRRRELEVGELRNRLAGEAFAEQVKQQTALDDLIDDINKKEQQRLDRLLDATPTRQLEAQRTEMQLLAQAYEEGQLGLVGSAEAMQLYSEAAQAFLGNAGDMDELTRSAIQASENIQNALGTTLKNALKGDFDDIDDAFSNLLLDMAAEAAAANIMDAFFGKANSQGKRSGAGILGDLGGLLDFLPSFDGGGFTGTGARSGGIDGKGGFLSVLHPSETVTDHTRGGSVGGGQTIVVHQNFTVGDVASISMVRQAVAGSEARIAAQFSRSQKYGGAAS